MITFIIRRLLWAIPVLFFVALVSFFLMHLAPGGPFDKDNDKRQLDPATLTHLMNGLVEFTYGSTGFGRCLQKHKAPTQIKRRDSGSNPSSPPGIALTTTTRLRSQST